MTTDPTTLRNLRLTAEANDLKRRFTLNGYKLGEPIDLSTMPTEHLKWQKRLWYIGAALNNKSLPENL